MPSTLSALKRYPRALWFILIFLPFPLWATVSYSNLSISNSNPSPGSVVGVTIVYCQNSTFSTPHFLVALNSASTNIQPCPVANQVLVVDNNTGNFGASPVNSTVADVNGTGWVGPATGGTLSCPATQVWNITIPGSLTAGSYNLIVRAGDFFVDCSSAGPSTFTTLTVPFPPAAINLIKVADGSTANANDLVLWRITYNYVNTGPVTITDVIPTGVTLAAPTGAISPGGTLSGSTITWVLPATLAPVTGDVWFLTQVDSGATAGTVIGNQASGASASAGSVQSNLAQVNIGSAGFTLLKSQSSATALPGSILTYTLAYQVSGSSLLSADSFGNNSVGTANGAIVGYDGTGFTYTNTGGVGGFTVQQDSQGNSYIRGCAINTCNSGVTNGNYPTLLRNGPALDLCNNFMAEGDMQIPAGSAAGADATLVIADNLAAPNVDDAYMLGMSLDNGPGNFFLQKNNSSSGTVNFLSNLGNASLGTTITAGLWYTAKVLVTYNAGALRFQAKIWPKGTLEPAGWSMDVTDASPLPCTPINGGAYQMGFQADGSSSTNYYSGLKLYGPSAVVDPVLWDTLPSAVVYQSSSLPPSSVTGNSLTWNLGGAPPVTTYNLNGSITLTAMVTCGGSGVNMASISSTGAVSTVNSNSVTLTVTGCGAPTATPTPNLGAAAVSLFDLVSQATADQGDLLTYTVGFVITSGGFLGSYTFTVTLPPNISFDSFLTNAGHVYDPTTRTITWTNGPGGYGPGFETYFRYQARVDSNAPGGSLQSDLFTLTYTGQTTPATTSSTVAIDPDPVDVFDVSRNIFNPGADGPVSIYVGYSIYGGDYSLRVYNSAGEQVKTLAKRYLTGPVDESYLWDGTNEQGEPCGSGVYLLYLVEPLDRKLKKIILIR